MSSYLARMLSRDGAAPAAPATPRSGVPASPSLNDFSMGAAAEWDVATELPSPASALGRRVSLDSSLASRHASMDGSSFGGASPRSSLDSAGVRSSLWRHAGPMPGACGVLGVMCVARGGAWPGGGARAAGRGWFSPIPVS